MLILFLILGTVTFFSGCFGILGKQRDVEGLIKFFKYTNLICAVIFITLGIISLHFFKSLNEDLQKKSNYTGNQISIFYRQANKYIELA